MDNRLATLRRILRIHFNWLTVKLLGKDLLSKEELDELKDYGRLSLGDEVGLVERSFALGRQSALSKKSEYKDLTLEKLSKLQKRKYTSVEELAIREAKLHTARRIKSLADDASASVEKRLNKATRELVADLVSKDVLADEVALAVAFKKTRQQLATSLANKLGREFTADMKKLAVTEMHRAKTRGAAMAIANKVGIYQRSDGPDSMVSVVPNKGACSDCRNLYLDNSGNPKVFKLKDMVAQGSNADEGVNHARGAGGLHTGWKPVMPPAHPNCYCELTYVPPGMAWENGRLKVVDELRYKESISKAVDQGSMAPTIKPPGPKSTQGMNKTPKVGSISGVAAPSNQAGPGRPAEGGPQVEYEYWGNRSGSPDPAQGWERAPSSGAWRRPLGAGAGGGEEDKETIPAPSPEEMVLDMIRAKDFVFQDHAIDVMRDHIQQGEVIDSKSLKNWEAEGAIPGINDSYKQTIKGNGSMLAKPGSIDYGSDIQKEAASFKAFTMFGSDRCPPTFIRTKDPLPASGQAWLKDHKNAMVAVEAAGMVYPEQGMTDPTKLIYAFLEKAPDKDEMVRQLSDIAVMDIILCNSDRHVENFMVNEDFSEVMAIDHGFCFEPGLNFYQGRIHEGFWSHNRNLKISPEMRERLESTSYGDIKRGFGDEHLQEWQSAQTYLRMKYMMQVADENDGNLPYEEFAGRGFGHSDEGRTHPAKKFEDFMIDFIDFHSADPSSSEHATAKHFAEIGVFMDPYLYRVEPKVYANTIAEGGNFRYEKEVRSAKAQRDMGGREQAEAWAAKARISHMQEVDKINDEEIVAALDKKDELWDALQEARNARDDFRDNNSEPTDEYWALQEKANEAARNYKIAEKELKELEQETERLKTVEARKFELIPPGQQERFDYLNQKILEVESGPRSRKAYRMDYGSNTRSAADIEREKRNG